MTQSADQTGDTSELTKESKSDGSEREPTDAEPHRSLFFRLQKYGCRRFPSFIPDPERHGRLEMYRSRDADNNAKSEPPSDEVCRFTVRLGCRVLYPLTNSQTASRFRKSRLEYR